MPDLVDKFFQRDLSEAEQAALSAADVIVWMHPVYWYSVPGLLKHWFDQVLVHGWAYGEGGNALRGKRCLWVTTTGGDEAAYSATGMHEQPFANFAPPIEETARFCGMHWESPVVIQMTWAVTASVAFWLGTNSTDAMRTPFSRSGAGGRPRACP